MAGQTLAQMVRAKYPGAYTQLSDQQLESAVRAKYPGTYDAIPSTPAPDAATGPQGSALERGATQFYEKSPLSLVVNAAEGVANAVRHPIQELGGLKPLARTAVGIVQSHVNEGKKAIDLAKDGRYVEAVGHAGAAALPVLGPLAADVGEHFAQGDVAGGVGGALGLLAPFAAKYAKEVRQTGSALPTPAKIAVANTAKAARLTQEAKQQVAERVLAPGNPKYKPTAQRIAPEVLERGLRGDRLQLQQLAEDGMSDAAKRIDAAVNIDPKAAVSLAPVLKHLDDQIADYHVQGKPVPGSEAVIAALKTQRDFIASYGTDLPFGDVRKLRQLLDAQAADAGAYVKRGDASFAPHATAALESASALRETLAANRPEAVGPNADFTFYKRLNDVLDPSKGRPKATNYVPSGVTGGMAATGAIAGAEMLKDVPGVGRFGAILGANLLPKIKAALSSPEWQLASAAKKQMLAEALERGDVSRAKLALSAIAKAGPRGPMTGLAVAPGTAGSPDSRNR